MKITEFNSDVENISKLSDRPNIEDGYTAASLKALFDKAGVDIKDYINRVLLPELEGTKNGESGADRIGSGEIPSLPGNSVQAKLVSLSEQINGIVNGVIPDGSVTPEKFASEIADFLTSASMRVNMYTEPGTHTFTVVRDGTYKFTLTGGGGGGGVELSHTNHELGGGGGATAIVFADLKAGDECILNVGMGGQGLRVTGSTLTSHATEGKESTLSVNGTLVARAEGGCADVGKRAVASGGTINYSGGYPKAGDYYGTTGGDIEFSLGGDSLLGNGAAFKNDIPGIGGGGYCGGYYGSATYGEGTDGGNGAVMIEYMK